MTLTVVAPGVEGAETMSLMQFSLLVPATDLAIELSDSQDNSMTVVWTEDTDSVGLDNSDEFDVSKSESVSPGVSGPVAPR